MTGINSALGPITAACPGDGKGRGRRQQPFLLQAQVPAEIQGGDRRQGAVRGGEGHIDQEGRGEKEERGSQANLTGRRNRGDAIMQTRKR